MNGVKKNFSSIQFNSLQLDTIQFNLKKKQLYLSPRVDLSAKPINTGVDFFFFFYISSQTLNKCVFIAEQNF